MAAFVRQTIGMYRSGFDSRRMLLQVGSLYTLCSSVSLLLRSHFVNLLAALTICSHAFLGQECQHAYTLSNLSAGPSFSKQLREWSCLPVQQSLAEFTKEGGKMSAGTMYMQQNTRLVVLTLEVR